MANLLWEVCARRRPVLGYATRFAPCRTFRADFGRLNVDFLRKRSKLLVGLFLCGNPLIRQLSLTNGEGNPSKDTCYATVASSPGVSWAALRANQVSLPRQRKPSNARKATDGRHRRRPNS